MRADRTDRRSVLARLGAAGLGLLAGCAGGGGGNGGGGDGDASPTGTPTETDSPTPTPSPSPTDSPTPTETPTPTASPTPSQEFDARVVLETTTFKPLRLEVDPGATVMWVNRDPYGHDVTAARFHEVAEQWSFSKPLSEGDRVFHTFESAGIYEYYCTIHGRDSMCGAVLVGDVTLNKDLPCEGGGY